MQGYRKSILSLAISGVLTGIMALPAYSADTAITEANDGGLVRASAVSDPEDVQVATGNSISIASDVAITTDATGSGPALTVDSESTAYELDITVDGSINGTLQSDNTTAATRDGLQVTGTSNITSDITINGSILGSGTGLNIMPSAGSFTGDIIIGTGASVIASSVAFSMSRQFIGNIVNNGSVGDSTTATAFNTAQWTGQITNTGSITASDNAFNSAQTVTLVNAASGVITGDLSNSGSYTITNNGTITGDLEATGTNTLTNSGTFTGDINGGTNTLTNNAGGVVSGAIIDVDGGLLTNAGTITATGALTALGITNDGSITADSINSGSAALTNNAAGTINVTNALTIGAASSNAGTINAGSFAAGANAFTNTGTATLGVMASTGTVTNSGTLSINEGSTVATYDGSGGTLELVATSGAGALLTASSSATLDADSKIVVNGSDAFVSSASAATNIELISGTLSATGFSTDNISSGSALISLSNLTLAGASVAADVEVLSADSVLDGSGATESTQSLASDFQTLSAEEQVVTGVYGTLIDNSGSTSEMNDYLDEIRPDDSGSAALTVSDATAAAMSNIRNRGASLRGISFGDLQTGDNLWIQALYSQADQDARGGNLGYESTLAGFTFGADRDMDGQTFGFAVSYGDSHIDFDGRDQRDEVTTYLGSLYHFMRRDTMYIDSSLTLGGSDHKGRRLSGAAQMNSKYHSEQVGVQSLAGMYMPRGRFMLEPMAAVRMSMVKVDGYTASNGDGTLTEQVGSTNYHKIEAGIGGAVSTSWETDKGMMTPRASVMVYHDFVGDSMDNQVTFAGNDYTLKSTTPEKTSYEAYLGVDMDSGENTTVNMGYTRVMKSGFSSDNLNVKLKYTF
ncbi:autotransporter outer membrane beta-barrel domain-containing protein [Endozoicomonas elysicola]|uniref:Autotransporter domain-containing protein n=1 Tax=Endozoicomonas elysicola TaxID=305900 RepID=A0A081KA34_9GAMM|nr:autotransporter outer membrane beta-barrel domain-containing protein [Endozoicomonas elysicola]KEI71010.1 hypothetical protein GV64_09865 [Endozoicomonas elysicola]